MKIDTIQAPGWSIVKEMHETETSFAKTLTMVVAFFQGLLVVMVAVVI